jgi:hypothetical protein
MSARRITMTITSDASDGGALRRVGRTDVTPMMYETQYTSLFPR